jgi:hypothetical protein
MYTSDNAGIAVSTPAPTDTRGRIPASRPIAHASGAASDPMRANGRADATGDDPNSQMNGTWTSDASGIQWALLGIGSVGSAGSFPPTSAKIQMKSTWKPCPPATEFATST